MNPVFGSRRRADEFDLLLTGASMRPAAEQTASPQYGDLLALVTTLRETPAAAPRPDFSAELRTRLMAAAEAALAPDTSEQLAARHAPAVRRSPRERRLAAAVGGFAIVSATASMAVAAQSALPGDTLYPLKRAIENAQTGVHQDADDKGASLLENATGRLDEVDALSRSGDDAQAIAATLDDFMVQATEASDLLLGDFTSTGQASSIEELRMFTADSMGALTSLQSLVPRDARPALIEATQVINAIDIQAQSLCPACTDLPIMAAPVFAAQAIDTLLDDALDPILSPTQHSAPRASQGTKASPAKPQKTSAAPSGQGPASSTPQSPSPAPEAPALPQPTNTSGDGDTKDPQGPAELLKDLNVSGSDDPIGDLLVGTDKTVDDVVDGVGDTLTDGLDGLGGLGTN